MPLLDHFHPPLSEDRYPEGLQNALASSIADLLNLQVLSKEFIAVFQIHVGPRVEVDVGTFEYSSAPKGREKDNGGVATLAAPVWAPPAPALQMPAIFPEYLEIQVLNLEGGRRLVAAIEIVSPSNKDRPDTRKAFAIKCANYLQQGIGLVIVDLVTLRRGNLQNELIDLLGTGPAFKMPLETSLYVVAYRPVRTPEVERFDIWPNQLHVGDNLPLVPLALGTSFCVPLDLEAAYADMCRRLRISRI